MLIAKNLIQRRDLLHKFPRTGLSVSPCFLNLVFVAEGFPYHECLGVGTSISDMSAINIAVVQCLMKMVTALLSNLETSHLVDRILQEIVEAFAVLAFVLAGTCWTDKALLDLWAIANKLFNVSLNYGFEDTAAACVRQSNLDS